MGETLLVERRAKDEMKRYLLLIRLVTNNVDEATMIIEGTSCSVSVRKAVQYNRAMSYRWAVSSKNRVLQGIKQMISNNCPDSFNFKRFIRAAHLAL